LVGTEEWETCPPGLDRGKHALGVRLAINALWVKRKGLWLSWDRRVGNMILGRQGGISCLEGFGIFLAQKIPV